MRNHLVYAIVVTYNGSQYIKKCIDSLVSSTINIKIVVVDNNSTDSTIEIINNNFNDIKMVELKTNIGFGKANNIGIKYAFENGADHFLLLNQDAYLQNGTVEELKNVQNSDKNLFLISPIHLNGEGNSIDLKFSRHLGLSKEFNRKFYFDTLLKKSLAEFYTISHANAAIWLLSRKCINEIGLFNPIFDHYGEDFEYLDRISYKGYNIALATKAIAYHDREQSNERNYKDIDSTTLYLKSQMIYKISRKSNSSFLNILSAISIPLFFSKSKYPIGIVVKLRLILYILLNYLRLKRYCDNALNHEKAFFDETISI